VDRPLIWHSPIYFSEELKKEGKEDRKENRGYGHKSRAGERPAKYSPSQVAIHGFHVVILAACKGAQLVEGHSWREKEFNAI
jgi:hypothetical protein